MKEGNKVSIFDTNIFLIGLDFNIIPGRIYTTHNVIEEIEVKKYLEKNRNILNRIHAAVVTKKLILRHPSDKYVFLIEEKSKKTGDYKALSEVDRELLALCLEIMEQEKGEVVFYSNDYSLLNVCSELSIAYSSIGKEGIKKKIMWDVYCPFCNISYKAEDLNKICERCGTKLKRKPKK